MKNIHEGLTPCQRFTKIIRSYFLSNRYPLNNQYIFNWESDFFCVTAANYVIECEIKISNSDFKADFKKLSKHKVISNTSYTDKPNRFYYVCPEGIISLSEVPFYAGLLIIDNLGNVNEIKKAPLLHKEKFECGRLLSRYYNKCCSVMDKLIKFQKDFTYGLPDNKKQELQRFMNKFHFDD